jgi:hypothetical protein
MKWYRIPSVRLMFLEGIRSGGSFKVRRFFFAAMIARINTNQREKGKGQGANSEYLKKWKQMEGRSYEVLY